MLFLIGMTDSFAEDEGLIGVVEAVNKHDALAAIEIEVRDRFDGTDYEVVDFKYEPNAIAFTFRNKDDNETGVDRYAVERAFSGIRFFHPSDVGEVFPSQPRR